MKTEALEYKTATLPCADFWRYDDQKSGKRPGILVMPEAFGFGAQAKRRARDAGPARLRRAGRRSVRERPRIERPSGSHQLVRPDCSRTRRSRAIGPAWGWTSSRRCRRSIRADWPRSAIAWAEPSRWNLRATVRRSRVSSRFMAACRRSVPRKPAGIKAKILVCTGADDPFVPPAQVNAFAEEMTKAKADWQVISYGGTVHSFTNPDADKVGNPALSYNKLADERSWKALTSFFEEIFGAA